VAFGNPSISRYDLEEGKIYFRSYLHSYHFLVDCGHMKSSSFAYLIWLMEPAQSGGGSDVLIVALLERV